jgi:ABC-type transporter Mla MlaB component
MILARGAGLRADMGERSALGCDVGGLSAPDLGTVAALARLQLEARRLGLELRLQRPSRELRELIAFVGLDEVLRVEPGGHPEQREKRLGVEEKRQLGDPPV